MSLNDKHQEEYKKPDYVAYSGEGAALGAIVQASDDTTFVQGVDVQGRSLVVDESTPKVRIQVRFPDGKRQVLQVNVTHSVRDVLSLVEEGRALGHYQLMSSERGPPKPLSKAVLDQDVKTAGIAGSVVIVKPVME